MDRGAWQAIVHGVTERYDWATNTFNYSLGLSGWWPLPSHLRSQQLYIPPDSYSTTLEPVASNPGLTESCWRSLCWLDSHLGPGTSPFSHLTLIQSWSGGLPPSPNPRKWLAFSLLLQSHPPPVILLPRNSHLSLLRLPLPRGVPWEDSPLGFTLNVAMLWVLGGLPWTPTMDVQAMSWQQALTETHSLLPQTHLAHIGDRTSHCPSMCPAWHRGPYCFCPCLIWALTCPE